MRCYECGEKILIVKTRNGKSQSVDLKRYTIVTDKGDILTGHRIHECNNNPKVIDLVEIAKNVNKRHH